MKWFLAPALVAFGLVAGSFAGVVVVTAWVFKSTVSVARGLLPVTIPALALSIAWFCHRQELAPLERMHWSLALAVLVVVGGTAFAARRMNNNAAFKDGYNLGLSKAQRPTSISRIDLWDSIFS